MSAEEAEVLTRILEGGKLTYYDRQGEPIDRDEWVKKFEDFDYKRVAFDQIETDDATYEVSTVWLGIDHSFTEDGPPVIFETMVFKRLPKGGDPDFGGEGQWRYPTEKEARFRHKAIVKTLREGTFDEEH